MPRYAMSPERYAAIFGASERAAEPGRYRLCRVCKGWHKAGHVPHNCRPPAERLQHLAAPQIAPPFEAFRTGYLEGWEVINSRNEKRDYMERNDLVEYDEGVGKRNEWVEENDLRREIIEDIRQLRATDTDYYGPDLKAQTMDEGGGLDDGTEIETANLEIIE